MANGMKIANLNITVIPAKAGIHFNNAANIKMDPRFREDDEIVKFVVYCKRLIFTPPGFQPPLEWRKLGFCRVGHLWPTRCNGENLSQPRG